MIMDIGRQNLGVGYYHLCISHQMLGLNVLLHQDLSDHYSDPIMLVIIHISEYPSYTRDIIKICHLLSRREIYVCSKPISNTHPETPAAYKYIVFSRAWTFFWGGAGNYLYVVSDFKGLRQQQNETRDEVRYRLLEGKSES